ncbi:MAG: YgaP-like transmembrane domain [Caldilineaceae bacterium]
MQKEYVAEQEAHPPQSHKPQRHNQSADGSPMPPTASLTTPTINVGTVERWLSLLGGGALLFRLLRRYGFFVGGAWVAAYLLMRGVTGRCALYRIAHVDSRGLDRWLFPGSAPCGEVEVQEEQLERRLEAESRMDEIDRTSNASFPASDPPATW